MKKKILAVFAVMILSGCGSAQQAEQPEVKAEQTEITTQEIQTVTPDEVGFEGMEAVTPDMLKDGVYKIEVDSSSSMFEITDCELTVSDGSLTAKMTMGGTGYEHLYMGTAENAANASESELIPYSEENGVHSFTVPVEALNKEIACAAFSKKKQVWYDRTLVFRADALPTGAYADGIISTVDSLGLADGEYTINVTLSGGSGKASVQSPAKLSIKEGKAYAEIVWSSNKYDYMIVDGEKIMPTSMDEFSVFDIPVSGFDFDLPVSADTTAMSKPYEIEYKLHFDSSTIS